MDSPRPTRGAPAEELLELVHGVARELVLRDEAPTGNWVEETVRELRSGVKTGFYSPPTGGGGLGFRSERGAISFGHVHAAAGPDAPARALALCEALLDTLPVPVRSISIGFTGLTSDQEASLARDLERRPGSRLIPRLAMERVLRSQDGEGLPPAPDALRPVAVREVTLEALTQLDQRAFRGTTDELLIGSEPDEYRRALRAILDGAVGRFLDEASVALYRPDPPLLAGALLTSEKTPRRAVFQDLMVDPDLRGRGHGAYLLHWGLRALWALGYERVRLWVSADNEVARRLYDSVGFSVTQTAVIYRWDRSPAAPQPQSAR